MQHKKQTKNPTLGHATSAQEVKSSLKLPPQGVRLDVGGGTRIMLVVFLKPCANLAGYNRNSEPSFSSCVVIPSSPATPHHAFFVVRCPRPVLDPLQRPSHLARPARAPVNTCAVLFSPSRTPYTSHLPPPCLDLTPLVLFPGVFSRFRFFLFSLRRSLHESAIPDRAPYFLYHRHESSPP